MPCIEMPLCVMSFCMLPHCVTSFWYYASLRDNIHIISTQSQLQ